MNLVNVAGIAGFVMYKNLYGEAKPVERKQYLSSLAYELVYQMIKRRATVQFLSNDQKRNIRDVLGDDRW